VTAPGLYFASATDTWTGVAPRTPGYITSNTHPQLSNERVVTDTNSIDMDTGTSGQLKAHATGIDSNSNGSREFVCNLTSGTVSLCVTGTCCCVDGDGGGAYDTCLSSDGSIYQTDPGPNARIVAMRENPASCPDPGSLGGTSLGGFCFVGAAPSFIHDTAGVTKELQQRVGTTCAVNSSIRVINQDGTVDCETDDTSGTVTIKEQDGSPRVAATALDFENEHGFVLVDETGGTARAEFNLSGHSGRSLSANTTTSPDSVDADAELYTREFSIAVKAPAATDDVLFLKVANTMTPTSWDCVAQGGSGLTTIDFSVEECNTSGASCAGIGATATMTTVDTNVQDAAFTDTTLTAANWLKVVIGTVTWTTPGFVTCSLKATMND
jgi:hypothetical protein